FREENTLKTRVTWSALMAAVVVALWASRVPAANLGIILGLFSAGFLSARFRKQVVAPNLRFLSPLLWLSLRRLTARLGADAGSVYGRRRREFDLRDDERCPAPSRQHRSRCRCKFGRQTAASLSMTRTARLRSWRITAAVFAPGHRTTSTFQVTCEWTRPWRITSREHQGSRRFPSTSSTSSTRTTHTGSPMASTAVTGPRSGRRT